MFLFTGPDNYESWNSALSFANDVAARSAATVVRLDIEDVSDWSQLRQRFDSLSMFGGGEVVLLKRLHADTAILSQVNDFVDKDPNAPLVIWEPDDVDGRSKLLNKMKKKQLHKHFPEPSDKEIVTWAAKQTKILSAADAAQLIQMIGKNKWKILSEIQKIELWLQANPGQKLQTHIKSIVSGELATSIWQMLDNLVSGNKSKAVGEMLAMGATEDVTQYVISMLQRELVILSQIKSTPNPAALELSPFVVKKRTRAAAAISWDKLKNLARALMRLEFAIKTGKIEPEWGLTMYLLSW